MILAEFAKFLQKREKEIVENKSTIKLLTIWIKDILSKKPENNVEKIIHTEISLGENKAGDFVLIAKSQSGRVLTNALYNFALSYEQHVLNKWLQNKKATDFNQEN